MIHRIVVTLNPGDRRVLYGGGVHNEIGEAKMQELLNPDLDIAAQVKVWRDTVWYHGLHDNLSLVMAMAAG